LKPLDLCNVSVLPHKDELVLFEKSCDTKVQEATTATRSVIHLRVSDNVYVHSGPLRGTLGRLVSIDDLKTGQIKTSDGLFMEMCLQDIQKAFSCGGFVTVEHQGHNGFVTEVDETHVMLYSMGSALEPEVRHATGEEVIVLTFTYACC
jgi:hypothetical protein